jgi:hypothetical protein
MHFDGVDDLGTTPDGLMTGVQRTVACWFNQDGAVASRGRLLEMYGTSTRRGVLEYFADARIHWVSLNSGTNFGDWRMGTAFSTQAGWKFVVCSYDGAGTTLHPTMWVAEAAGPLSKLTNGAGLVRVQQRTAAEAADGGVTYIGATNAGGGSAFEGHIAEAAIWANKLLSDVEVANIYTLGMLAVPPTYYWPLDFGGQALLGGMFATITGALVSQTPPLLGRPAGRRG